MQGLFSHQSVSEDVHPGWTHCCGWGWHVICALGAKVFILEGRTDVDCVLTSVCEKGCPSWMDTMPWAGMAYDLSARVSILDGQTDAGYAMLNASIRL